MCVFLVFKLWVIVYEVFTPSPILVENDELTDNLLPIEIQLSAGNVPSGDAQFDLHSVEKQHSAKVMAYTKGNKVEAARLLNIGLTTLYRKIEEYQL